MATLGSSNLTLVDWAKRRAPRGGVEPDVAELLTLRNQILTDMIWLPANGATFHRSTIRTGLPAVTWRQFYQGVQPSKSTTAQVED
jgi:Major capsid protein GP7